MTRATDNIYSLERDVVTLFGRCTGSDRNQLIAVTDCESHFLVGDTVTGGTSSNTGLITRILSETGDFEAAAGITVMNVVTSGDLTATEVLEGAMQGLGVFDSFLPDVENAKGKGVDGVFASHVSTGRTYDIVLEDMWAGLLGVNATVIDPTSTKHWDVVVVSESVAASTKTIKVALFAAADATAAESPLALSTDETLIFEIVLSQTGSLTGY